MKIHLYVLVFIIWSTNMVSTQDYYRQDDYSCDNCEHKYTYRHTRKGTFTSPGFPEPYETKQKCCYVFQAKDDGRVRIEFDYFDLEASDDNCKYDYIEISSMNERGVKEQPTQMYCGTSTPPVYISSHSILEIIFKSDMTTNARGFLGHYEFLETNWHPFPPSTIGCGPGYLTGHGGSIYSPNYPDTYHAESGCTWIIQVDPGKRILLTFVVLDITSSIKCQDSNILMIFEGFMTPDQDPVRYCGQLDHEPKLRREYLSDESRIVIRFQADGNYGGQRGFHLTWTAVAMVTKDGSCEGFRCKSKGPDKCEMSLEKNMCVAQYYCIDDSLTCNELPNCGYMDNSDETKCLNYILKYVGIIGGSILLVVVTVIIIAVCCYKRRNRDRVKYTVPTEQSMSNSMNTCMSSRSSNTNNMPVPSLDHSPRSSCIMYTTSFTDCTLAEQSAHSTPNHSSKPTLNSFKSPSLPSNSLQPPPPPSNAGSNASTNGTTVCDANGDIRDDIIHSTSYKGHQKRPSYHMMQELCYDDGNMILAEI